MSPDVRQVVQTVQAQVDAAAAGGKAQLAERVAGLARAVRSGGEGLRADERTRLAWGADALATELEEAGEYLKAQEIRALLGDLRALVSRRGWPLLGGMLALGLLAAYLAPRLQQPLKERPNE